MKILTSNNRRALLTSVWFICVLTGCGGASSTTPASNGSITTTSTTTTSTTPQTSSTYNPSIIEGALVTDIKIESTSASSQTNVPFTFGQVFAPGDLSPGQKLAGKFTIGGNVTLIPLQVDVKATHGDTSVRHAILSGVIPSVASSASPIQTMQLVKATLSGSSPTAPTTSELMANGATASVSITLNGVAYSVSLASLLANAQTTVWLAGPIVNEWLVSGPLKNAQGVAHPHLTAQFAVRSYTGQSKARVDVTIENTRTFVPGMQNQTYAVQFVVAGQTVYTNAALTHFHQARWRKMSWWGTAPQAHIKHNIPYLLATKAVPNYDQNIAISAAGLSALNASWLASNTEPMGAVRGNPGLVTTSMSAAGGRPDIGLLPQWAVMYLLSMDSRAKTITLGVGDQAGSWPIHYRDEGTGFPVRLDNAINKNISTHPNASNVGPLPVPRCSINWDPNPTCYTYPVMPDAAHEPSMAYVPYLVTGDYYYLEELQFWAAWNPLETGAGYRDYDKGLTNWQQLRGQAWSLRTMGQAAYITPDNHYLKSYLLQQLNYSIDFYTTTFAVGNPNQLGVMDGSGAQSFAVDYAIQPWQDDFFTWSVGYLNELGFTNAHALLVWKVKFQVGRMDTANSGFCWIDASSQALIIRPVSAPTGPVYTTFAQVYQDTFSNTDANVNNIRASNGGPVTGAVGTIYTGTPYLNWTCGSQQQADWYGFAFGQMTGYAGSPIGTPAILGAALAIAADSTLAFPNAQTAWNQYLARSSKPDFSAAPQWALVPR